VFKQLKSVLLCTFCILLLGSTTAEAALQHAVQRGETLWRISRQYSVTVAAIDSANNLTSANLIQAGQVLVIPGRHRVSPGETLWRISQNYGSTVTAFAQANGISNTYLIIPGQILVVPGAGQERTPLPSRMLPPVSGVNLSQAEMDLLARLVRAEAGGEPYIGQVAVAASVLNRVRDPRFPDTVTEVIFQVAGGFYQYCPVENGTINIPADQSAINAVRDAVNGSDPSLGATGFYNPRKTTNQWVRRQPVTTVIANHIFFR
jgi:N-acetylmuramoyl-L-alanine amidase